MSRGEEKPLKALYRISEIYSSYQRYHKVKGIVYGSRWLEFHNLSGIPIKLRQSKTWKHTCEQSGRRKLAEPIIRRWGATNESMLNRAALEGSRFHPHFPGLTIQKDLLERAFSSSFVYLAEDDTREPRRVPLHWCSRETSQIWAIDRSAPKL